nr:unnamed protein product [Gossypium raimondii]
MVNANVNHVNRTADPLEGDKTLASLVRPPRASVLDKSIKLLVHAMIEAFQCIVNTNVAPVSRGLPLEHLRALGRKEFNSIKGIDPTTTKYWLESVEKILEKMEKQITISTAQSCPLPTVSLSKYLEEEGQNKNAESQLLKSSIPAENDCHTQAEDPVSDVPKYLLELGLTPECKQLISSLPAEKGWVANLLHQYQSFWHTTRQLQAVLTCQNHFQAQETDILLVTTAKSGTTWLKAIVFALMNRVKYPNTDNNHPLL